MNVRSDGSTTRATMRKDEKDDGPSTRPMGDGALDGDGGLTIRLALDEPVELCDRFEAR